MWEAIMAQIQNEYLKIYVDNVSAEEWDKINEQIRLDFAEYNKKIDRDTEAPVVINSVRRVLPKPAAPILIESEDCVKKPR